MGDVVFTSQPVEKNRDGTRVEIMFMDEIINVTEAEQAVGAEQGR